MCHSRSWPHLTDVFVSHVECRCSHALDQPEQISLGVPAETQEASVSVLLKAKGALWLFPVHIAPKRLCQDEVRSARAEMH